MCFLINGGVSATTSCYSSKKRLPMHEGFCLTLRLLNSYTFIHYRNFPLTILLFHTIRLLDRSEYAQERSSSTNVLCFKKTLGEIQLAIIFFSARGHNLSRSSLEYEALKFSLGTVKKLLSLRAISNSVLRKNVRL